MRLADVPVKQILLELNIRHKTQVETWVRWYRNGEVNRLKQPVGKQYSFNKGPESDNEQTKLKECSSSKRLLAKDKIRVVKWEKIDEYFSDLTVATAGEDLVLTYANMALKTQVEKLLLSHQNK
ncbi:hypothetical protein FC756_08300 [Lysinibacillus mangiferihumi]|uniref:Helix-turn-helix domain-containing protein n=1 Tax=Lysinibacillus mangiferihumi TaxID=1130819 RepID=A0A4U2Z9J9_9BACI|nr:hypothetical protein FC756_08300 [Lysinibacillus mangiferihumi]